MERKRNRVFIDDINEYIEYLNESMQFASDIKEAALEYQKLEREYNNLNHNTVTLDELFSIDIKFASLVHKIALMTNTIDDVARFETTLNSVTRGCNDIMYRIHAALIDKYMIEKGVELPSRDIYYHIRQRLGHVCQIGAYKYRIAHVTDVKCCFVSEHVLSECIYNNAENCTDYTGSAIEAECEAILNALPKNIIDNIIPITIDESVVKVFVPSAEEFGIERSASNTNGFEIFKTFEDRICFNRLSARKEAKPVAYWTRSKCDSGKIVTISKNGYRRPVNPQDKCGLRVAFWLPTKYVYSVYYGR